MFNWIKNKLGIVKLEREQSKLNKRLNSHADFVDRKMGELSKLARIDADIGYRGSSTIILSGVYRGRAYVKFYDIKTSEFQGFVEQLDDMKKTALVRNIDAPPAIVGSFDLRTEI